MTENIACPFCGHPKTHQVKDSRTGLSRSRRCNNSKCRRSFVLGKHYPKLDTNKQISDKNMSITEKGISITEFRAKNDPKVIIDSGIKKLTKDKLFKTSDFKTLIGLPTNFSSRELMETSQLDGYHGKLRGEIYWSHPDTIRQLKYEAILS